MDSGPRTSPEAPGLGPAIAARVAPRIGIGRRSALTRVSIGGLARTIAGFGRSLGLARSARPVPAGSLSTTTVRPPVGYWPWADSLEPPAVTPAAPARRPTPKPATIAPAVGSGDAKVDSLRRLLGLPPLVMAPPESATEAGSGVAARGSRHAAPNATVTHAEHRTGTTVAGAETGPGRLGRRLVPETVRADASTSSVVPTAPQGAPTTTAARPFAAGAAAPARDGEWPRRQQSSSARGTRDVESLQRSLAASGRLSNPRDGRDGGGTGPASTSRAATRRESGSDGRGDAPESGGVPATGARTSPAVRVTDSGEGGAADGREGASSSATTTRETTKESTRTSGRDDVSATSATHASSRTLTRDGPPATTATTAPVLRGLDRMADGLTTTIDQPIARSVTAADAVRLRRLIRQTSNGDTDFVADVDNAEFVADVDNADIVADVDNAVVRPAGPILDQGLPAGEHDVAIATLPTEARPERVMTRRATNLTPHDVLRRVSLPRAMSRRDRPVSSLTAAVMRRRHEATRTRHSPDGKATISRGGQTSPTPGADVRPPATGRSQAGADPADRGVPQRWDISAAPTSHASTAPPTAPTSNPSTSRPSTTNSSTAAPFSPTRAPSASSRDETSAAASVLRRAIAGDMSQAPVQPASVRPPTPSTSAELSTFSAAVDHRHVVTERAHEVAASLIAGEPIHWPSPGTMFAPATFERRAADAGVSSGARRSVVAPGPGALRSVLRNIDATADEASPITHPEAVRDASRNASTRGRPITAPAAAAARPSRTERAPETFTDIVTSHRDDGHRDATHTDAAPGSAVGPPIVRTAAPKKDQVAARFLTELSRGERSQPQPLPAPYRPMAEAITGHHRVLISTDDASRRALRAVNKIAATTGDVIHLAAPPAVGLRHAELLAHELTHVAHPSPAPRFFADDDRGPEERRADEIARVIARSPLAPTASIGRRAAASTGPTSGDVIRRAPVSRSTRGRPSDAGTTSAAALAEQITRGATTSSSSTHTIRRFDDMPPLPPIPPPNTAPSLATTSTAASGNLAPGSEAFWKQVESTEAGSDWFRSQLQANFDRIVRLLERHMIGELERRGGRNWKGY